MWHFRTSPSTTGRPSSCWQSKTKKIFGRSSRRLIWQKGNLNWADFFCGRQTRTTFSCGWTPRANTLTRWCITSTPTFFSARPGNLQLLRENRLLPLATLFTVDTNSPYYHEENKGSIFYAESWALTHYLYAKDYREKAQHLTDYAELLIKQVDPVTAATRAFGDLKQLQSNLESYIRQGSFNYFKMPNATEVDDTAFNVRALTGAQADAVRADFLVCNDRVADARPLLDHVLQEDPKNVSAHETMGFLEFRAGHLEEARKWYEQAVKLDSQSYVAHYYFAAISMNSGANPADDAQVESSLRAAIKLNPSFAPPFEGLAALEGMRHRNLDEAHQLALNAVQLDPANVAYRVNVA